MPARYAGPVAQLVLFHYDNDSDSDNNRDDDEKSLCLKRYLLILQHRFLLNLLSLGSLGTCCAAFDCPYLVSATYVFCYLVCAGLESTL